MKLTLPQSLVSILFVAMMAAISCEGPIATSKENKEPEKVGAAEMPAPSQIKVGDPLPANLFVELAKAVNPTVVSISVVVRQMQQSPWGRDPFFDMFEDFMGPRGRGRPQEDRAPKPQAIGTGFVIDESGLIITNNHVIEHADDIKVQFVTDSERSYDAEVIGKDARTDIALIRVKAGKKLPFVRLGSSDKTEVGEWVAAFGNPYGHTFSMTKGIVSAKGRSIRDLNAVPFIQTDASINPGNSGGPLVNVRGEVIGVNAAIDARAQGIGFAIPIDHVKGILPQLKEKGEVTYGYLGVEMAPISRQAIAALKLPSENGALIVGVIPGSPADKGGLVPYDVVTEVGGKKVKDVQDLSDIIKDSPVGKEIKMAVIREGKSKTLNIAITAPPKTIREARRGPPPIELKSGVDAPHNIGFKTQDWNEKLAREFDIPPDAPRGPIVVQVQPNSAAALNGLRRGDMILDVNRVTVKSAADVTKNLSRGSNLLRVFSKGRVSLVFIELEN
jgi:serine protease Do